jgi:hypothetical protein
LKTHKKEKNHVREKGKKKERRQGGEVSLYPL